MTLKTSLLITGDASTAQKAVNELKQSVDQLATAGEGAAGGVAAVAAAETAATASSRAMGAAVAETAAAERALATSAATAGAALATMGASAAGSAGAVEGATKRVRQHSQAVNDNTAEANRNAFGVRNLGQQFGDLAVQIQGGIDPARAFATQAGQMGYALSEMSGKAGAVGKFLVGPWGVALTIAVSVLAPFAEKLFESGQAADDAGKKMLSQADAAKALAESIRDLDKATAGSIRTTQQAANAAYIDALNLRNQEIATRNVTRAKLDQMIADRQGVASIARYGGTTGAGISGALGAQGSEIDQLRAQVAAQATLIAQAQASANRLKAPILQGFAREATDPSYAATRRHDRDLATLNAQLVKGTISEGAYQAAVERSNLVLDAATKSRSSAANAGAVEADQQARLATAHGAVARAVAQLAITRREGTAEVKAGTLSEAEYRARLIAGEQAVNRARDAEKGARTAKVEHAKATRDLAAAQRELDSAYADVTRTLDPIKNAQREYDKRLAEIAKLRAAGKIGIGDDVALSGAARSERDKATAIAQVQLLKTAFETVNPGQSFEDSLIHSAVEASDRLKAGAVDAGNALVRAVNSLGSILGDLFPGASSGAIGRAAQAGSQLYKLTGKYGREQQDQLAASIKTIAGGVGISDKAAQTIGDYGGKAIRGAAEGALANSVFAPIAKGLGIKGSQTGAQIGGAIGQATDLPGGAIAGSILGSVVGGLFKSTPSGKVSLTSATGDVSATGNSSAARAAAVGLAGGVQDGLRSIAEQLGGSLGAFNVTVGQRHGDYRVTTGTSLKKDKGAKDFDDDQAGAVGYAVQLAISQGAVQGLSAAVQKAIKSSPDVDAALKEALKVQDVEALSKGLSGQFQKAFSDLEATAKERVRIARDYGLDVVAIEKRNAEDRVKLTEQLTKAQAGSLQSLIEELTSGSLFEGSALDQIDALNGRIAKAKAGLDAGVDGTGDTLADLYQKKLTVSKDAYGTTAAYAADRNSTIAEAQAAIARVNAQITSAQQSDPALKETNAALDENNSQNAEVLNALTGANGLLALIADRLGVVGGGGTNAKLEELAAYQ